MGAVADVQTYLAAQGLVDGVTGWTSVRRRPIDSPDEIVVISEDGGGAPEIGAASGIGDVAMKDPAVQVLVRAAAWDSDAAFAKAVAIFNALHGKLGATIGATTYMRVAAQSSEPVFIGFEEDTGRPQFTTSYRMKALV